MLVPLGIPGRIRKIFSGRVGFMIRVTVMRLPSTWMKVIRLGLLLDQIDGFRGEAFLGLVFNLRPHLIDTSLQGPSTRLAIENDIGCIDSLRV